jgi:phage tail-like protein
MDANGLRFWLLADQAHWLLPDGAARARYDGDRRTLRLSSALADPDVVTRLLAERDTAADAATATKRLAHVAQTRDAYGTRAWWDPEKRQVRAAGAIPDGDADGVLLFSVDPGDITDLAVGYDGVLYAATARCVVMWDLRDRWHPVTVRHANFAAWRLAPEPSGGVWVLDREHSAIWRVSGQPFPRRPVGPYAATTVRPCVENPDPPRVTLDRSLNMTAGSSPVTIASAPDGRLAVLAWAPDGGGRLYLRGRDGDFGRPLTLRGARFPYDVTWTSSASVAVLLTQLPKEAPVYPLDAGGEEIAPAGEYYPLPGHEGGPFVNGLTLPAHYPATGGSAPLYPISAPTLVTRGVVDAARPLDSGSTQTVWHRLYLEASIPPGCSVTVSLAATDDLETVVREDDWHEHRFGETGAAASDPAVPRGVWMRVASELPFHPGLLSCPAEPGRSGLFTVLIQRSNRRVRALRGRYLHVRVTLIGDGRTTPDIGAVRAYASRFSYRDHYLPELYHETEFGTPAEEIIRRVPPHTPDTRTPADFTTPADFLERFLDNLEGILTPLEERIASAYLLTDPRTAPESALEWLASWIGATFDPAYPIERRRELLRVAPALYRRRGTLAGLRLALDTATGGACSGGEIVVVEDFRLRRTFATILGVDLAREEDPLLGGITDSGNSYVGDTLFLGDEQRKEFLALFGDDMPTTAAEDAAIRALFDRLAHRVTVLVHREVSPQNLGLIRRVVELETPAHVTTRVVEARYQFMVGVASLVGVDTYLGPPVGRGPVLVGRSPIGGRDFLQRPASLDYRLGGGAPVSTGNGSSLVRAT